MHHPEMVKDKGRQAMERLVLSDMDVESFIEDGYLVVRNSWCHIFAVGPGGTHSWLAR